MSGSIGSFYFGPEIKNITVTIPKIDINLIVNEINVSLDSFEIVKNLNLVIRTLQPQIKIYDHISIDFSASSQSGQSPFEVLFTALPKFTNNFSLEIEEYKWYFDFENYPNVYESTEDINITHIFSGNFGDRFSVKLEVVLNSTYDREISIIKHEYIVLINLTNRVGVDRLINLTNYIPNYFKSSDIFYLVKTFEDYLNEMYVDEYSSPMISYTDVDGIDSLRFSNLIKPSKISILEKINRITELQDPDYINVDNIQFFANNLGYNVNINREQFGTENNIDIEKYLRFMVGNLSNWYKIKSTRNSIKTMLFSFGLVGDLVYYYTKEYDEFGRNWMYGDIYFDENDNKLKEDLSNIPSTWYPTSHFSVWYDINKSGTNFSYYDSIKRNQIINAIDSVRPINTVFKGIIGKYSTNKTINIRAVHKISKSIVIRSNNSDYWNK